MTHTAAKQLLARQASGSRQQIEQAVEAVLALGMPLCEIEAYLDWLDARPPQPTAEAPPPKQAEPAAAPAEPHMPHTAARKRKRRVPTQ